MLYLYQCIIPVGSCQGSRLVELNAEVEEVVLLRQSKYIDIALGGDAVSISCELIVYRRILSSEIVVGLRIAVAVLANNDTVVCSVEIRVVNNSVSRIRIIQVNRIIGKGNHSAAYSIVIFAVYSFVIPAHNVAVLVGKPRYYIYQWVAAL